MAWLGNRVMNAEIWGHVKKHCSEIATNNRRLDAHSDRLINLGERCAVLEARNRWEHDQGDEE